MKYYTEDHEWVEIIGESAVIGISQYAIDEFGDVTAVELPDDGDDFIIGDRIGSLETDSYTVELCAPICGSVVKVNEALIDEPEWAVWYATKNVLLMPEVKLRLNFNVSFWEIVIQHTQPLGVVPPDMRARQK